MVKLWMKIINEGLLVLGLLIVFGTHIMILAKGIPQEMLGGHAVLNIIAGVFILIHIIADEVFKRIK